MRKLFLILTLATVISACGKPASTPSGSNGNNPPTANQPAVMDGWTSTTIPSLIQFCVSTIGDNQAECNCWVNKISTLMTYSAYQAYTVGDANYNLSLSAQKTCEATN